MGKLDTKPPFPPGSRVVAYLRDSGGEDQDLSVAQQEAFMHNWCLEKNLVLTRIFADVATPGSSVIGRVQFRKLIDHFQDPACSDAGLILWKFSRFSRDIDDAQFYRADLRRRGYVVYSIQDAIPDTTDGRIYESLIDWMNHKYLEDLSMDVKRGLHHLVTTYGALPGVPPRGFKREPVNIGLRRDGTPHTACRWSPDPLTWDLCLRAWTMRAQGISIRKIHQELHLYSSTNSYTTFFKNRIYLGELKYGEEVIREYVQPMITREIWDIVQGMNARSSIAHTPLRRAANPGHPRRENSNFLLSGLLYCPRCGSLMNGMTVRSKKSGLHEYYHCSNANSHLDCDAKRIPKMTVENVVIEKILEYVLDPRVIQERDRELALAGEKNLSKVQKEIDLIGRNLSQNEKKRINLANKIADLDDAPYSMIELLKMLEGDKLMLEQKLERMKSILNHETVFIRDLAYLDELTHRFAMFLQHDDIEKRRSAVRLIVNRVAAERDGVMVRGIIRFYNPTDEPGGFMPMDADSVEAPEYRHKIYTIEFCVFIKRKAGSPRLSVS